MKWLTCMGDSMTNTETTLGIPERQQYPHLTAAAIGGACRARNLGVPGNTTSQMLARVEAMLDPVPTVAIIWGGINDLRQGVDDAVTRRNLEQMVDALREAGCRRVMLLSIHRMREPALDAQFAAKRAVIREVAADTGVAFYDLHQLPLAPSDYHPDGLHLEPSGLARIAGAVKAELDRLTWTAALRA